MNIIDSSIIIVLIIETIVNYKELQSCDFQSSRIFLCFRILRLMRNLEYIRVISFIMKKTFLSFISILIILLIIILIYSIFGLQIFGNSFKNTKNWNEQQFSFNTIEESIISVLGIITLDDWFGILITSTENKVNIVKSLVFLISLIFIGNFIILNLFVTIMLYGFEVIKDLKINENDFIASKLKRILFKYIFGEKITKDKKINSQESSYIKISLLREKINHFSDSYSEYSFGIFSKNNWYRKFCTSIVTNYYFNLSFYIFISLSFFLIITDTFFFENNPKYQIYKITSKILKISFNLFFTLQVHFKIISLGFFFHKNAYLKSTLNIIDFISLLGYYLNLFTKNEEFPLFQV